MNKLLSSLSNSFSISSQSQKREDVIMEKLNNPEPCTCRLLHTECNPQTCLQAQYALLPGREFKLEDFWASVQRGCQTCAVIVSGLLVPEVKAVWQESIAPAIESGRAGKSNLLEDEKQLGVEFLDHAGTESRVMVRTRASGNSADWRHFNYYLDPSCKQAFTCNAFRRPKCLPVARTDSDQSLQHLRDWVQECNETHNCYPKSLPLLPTRVLRISGNRLSVFVSENQRARYATLSHRWGYHEDFTLRRTNLQYLTRNISPSTLPKTYQDAIDIARKLGLEYIWIDSICIMQDDNDDWNRESQRMRTIYGNSYVNIAANEAKDSAGGCFSAARLDRTLPEYRIPIRPLVIIRRQPHFTHLDYGSNYGTSAASPVLLQRGWVLQERLLSPRVVYYGKEEILWECNSTSDCECGAIKVIARFRSDYYRSSTQGVPLPFAWMRVVEKYTGMQLTYDKDRFIALSGIAQQAAESGRGESYLAGLWKQNLAHQLCWTITNTFRKPNEYMAPSWSWASVFGRVNYTNRMDFRASASKIDVSITDAACEALSDDMTGAVKSGYLKLNGRMVEMRANVVEESSDDRPARYRLLHQETETQYSSFSPDYIMQQKAAHKVTQLTILYWGEMWTRRLTYMVLQKTSWQGKPAYERFGLFALSPERDQAIHKRLLDLCQPQTDIVII